jgi:hypothetical protein
VAFSVAERLGLMDQGVRYCYSELYHYLTVKLFLYVSLPTTIRLKIKDFLCPFATADHSFDREFR